MSTPIGFRDDEESRPCVAIPHGDRLTHTRMIGLPGTGKSTLMEHMAVSDVQQGHGVAVLDPRGGLVDRLLRLIPPDHVDRVIYLTFSDPDWIPIWNPLLSRIPACRHKIVDCLIRYSLPSHGFGDRSEHILRMALAAILRLPTPTLQDVRYLLDRGSGRGAELLSRARKIQDDEVIRRFFSEDFHRYRPFELQHAARGLDKLLGSQVCSSMLSQKDSSFDLEEIMRLGKILLVDLSSVDASVCEILGSVILSLLHLAATTRQDPGELCSPPFHIHCDEANRFAANAMEALMAEGRRVGVSLTLAYQRLAQFASSTDEVLSGVGTTVAFNVNTQDSRHLFTELLGRVEAADLVSQPVGRAIARISSQVVRLTTFPPLAIPDSSCPDLILRTCHERHYRSSRPH